LPAVLLLGTAALLFVPGSSAEGPTIEAAGPGSSGYFWRPSTASTGLGGTVTFKNPSDSVPHGLKWTGGPGAPSCTGGVPVNGEGTSWSGDCTFGQAGTYSFVCTVHPTEMKGTITVSSTEVPVGPPPPSGGATESPLRGPASRALSLAKLQRGSLVRGSINLSQASAGGRLEVLLLAKGGGRVGRLSRSDLRAGRLSFTVPLKAGARRTLRAQKRLPLTVQVVVTPPGRAALTLKRGVVLHV
jgi:plastocyanin